jgi:hypothetical protein
VGLAFKSQNLNARPQIIFARFHADPSITIIAERDSTEIDYDCLSIPNYDKCESTGNSINYINYEVFLRETQ